MKLTRARVIELYTTLKSFKGKLDKTFGMYVLVNEKKITPTIQEIDEIRKLAFPSEKMIELQQEEREILFKYASKDKEGNPIQISENRYKIEDGSLENYKKEVSDFMEINKFQLDEYNDQIQHVNKLLLEEIEVDVMLIPFEVIPEDLDLRTELNVLSDIIKEDFIAESI